MASSTDRRRVVVIAAVVLSSIGLLGMAFAPALLTYSPLLLIALSPIPRHLVLAAPITDPVPFVMVSALRRVLSSVVLYHLGESFGDSGLDWLAKRYPKARKLAQWIDWAFRRAGAAVLVIAPNPAMAALAGNARVPMWQFVPAVAIGHAIWCTVTYWVGDFLSAWTAPFLAWLRENVVSTTIACMVAVAAYQMLRRHRQRKRAGEAIHSPLEP